MIPIRHYGMKTIVLVLWVMCLLSLTGLGLPPGVQADDSVSAYVRVSSHYNLEGTYFQQSYQYLDGRQLVSAATAKNGKFPYITGLTVEEAYIEYNGSARAAADAGMGSLKVWAQCDGGTWTAWAHTFQAAALPGRLPAYATLFS